MQSIAITPSERKELIQEMKREHQPSRRLRMPILLLTSDGLSPTEIAGVLFCSRTTVYAVVSRFVREKWAAFFDRQRRGPKPLLGVPANGRIELLVEEGSPASRGWLRSRWSCKLLAVELFKEQLALVSRETTRRALQRMGFRWRRPHPIPPEKDSEHRREQKHAYARRYPANGAKSGVVLPGRDEAGDQSQSGLVLDAQGGKQKPLPTPGTNRKAWISAALNFHTGRLHWVVGKRKDGGLFIKLLDELRKTYRCHKELHLATDNDGSHTSKRVEKYEEDLGGRIHLHPLLSWSPESNPVELVWWSLHEAVSCNHRCSELDDLMEFAEGYLRERQPFMLKLGEVYERLERSPP